VVDELGLLDAELQARADLAFERLEERRMPETTRRRRELDRRCRGFAGEGVEVHYDGNFAAEGVELRLRVSSRDDLAAQAGRLGERDLVEELERILELL
jgi:hypothetical protein